LDEVLSILHESPDETRILAGGTDLLVNMKQRTIQPKKVVYLGSVPGMNSVAQDKDGTIRIGANTNLTDLSKNGLISKNLPDLGQAAASVASRHIRNMASIGGNICLENRCWYYNQSKSWREARGSCLRTGGDLCHAMKGAKRCHAVNASDTAPMLMALEAKLEIVGQGTERTIPIQEFFRNDGLRHTGMESRELLKEIAVPLDKNSHTTFIKVCKRKGIDFSTGTVAAKVTKKGKRCTNVRIILGSIISSPLNLKQPSCIIQEEGLTEDAINKAVKATGQELGVVSNLFDPATYKRNLARSLVRQALNNIKDKIKS